MDFRILKYFPFSGAKRLDVVAEFFNLFNSANVSQVNPVFGSGLTPIPAFRQPIAGPVPAKPSSLWTSSFEKRTARRLRLRTHMSLKGVPKIMSITLIRNAFPRLARP